MSLLRYVSFEVWAAGARLPRNCRVHVFVPVPRMLHDGWRSIYFVCLATAQPTNFEPHCIKKLPGFVKMDAIFGYATPPPDPPILDGRGVGCPPLAENGPLQVLELPPRQREAHLSRPRSAMCRPTSGLEPSRWGLKIIHGWTASREDPFANVQDKRPAHSAVAARRSQLSSPDSPTSWSSGPVGRYGSAMESPSRSVDGWRPMTVRRSSTH